jgi:hypothetical protein
VYQGVLKTASGEVDVAIKTLRGGDAIENQKRWVNFIPYFTLNNK